MTVKAVWAWVKAVGVAVASLLGLAALIGMRRSKERRHEEAAGRAEGEADRVEEAGKRDDAKAVLDSFRRGTE